MIMNCDSDTKTQFNHASVQHQTQHQHSWCARFAHQTQGRKFTIQEKGLVFFTKATCFKAVFS